MNKSEIELLFVDSIMELMDEAIELLVLYNNSNYEDRKFQIIKELSSLTAELIDDENIYNRMLDIAKQSEYNGDNLEDKFQTFKMIRNLINHFPCFKTWDDIYVSKELLNWNGKGENGQINNYFKRKRNFSYVIFLNKKSQWIPEIFININTPKLDSNNKIFIKDIMTLDDALWTFSIIDYYLQLIDLDFEPRIHVSA